MGEILKQKYQERDLIKALALLNGFCDEKTAKLSDKLENLKLSHNRKYKLLENIEKNLKILIKEQIMSQFGIALITDLLCKINKELTYCGRVKGIF